MSFGVRLGDTEKTKKWVKMTVPGMEKPIHTEAREIYVEDKLGISNKNITHTTMFTRAWGPHISVVFDLEGAAELQRMTDRNKGKLLVYMLNGKPIETVPIEKKISVGQLYITKIYSYEEAERVMKAIRKKKVIISTPAL